MLPGCRARCFHRGCWRHSTNSTSAVIAATKELAEAVPVDCGAMVLDVGSGLGGPSRYLAATYGCHVTLSMLSNSSAVAFIRRRWTSASSHQRSIPRNSWSAAHL